MTHEKQLFDLAKKRKNYDLTTFKKKYKNIGDYHNGIYDCDFVSPYSKSANNINARIMIFLQDWSSHNALQGNICHYSKEYGHTPSLPTNKNLKELLKKHFGIELKDTYATNLFPFVKMNNMSSFIPSSDMKKAALEFALPQVDIISPKIIICLGLSTFNALRRVNNIKACKTLSEGISSPFRYKSSIVYCQSHTGQLGRYNRNRGGVDRVNEDWSLMACNV